MKRFIPIIALSLLTLFGCEESNKTYLPSISLEEMQDLYKTCNQIDYLFYELPISSSINDQNSAQVHLRHISEEPVPTEVKNNCGKAIGRLFYKKDGEDLIESEVYFSSGCTFFVFFKNGQPAYSNIMTPDGVNHFNQILETVQNARNAQQK